MRAAVEAEGWSEFIRMFADYSPAVREVVERFRNIKVFARLRGEWRCVAWQATRVADPQAR